MRCLATNVQNCIGSQHFVRHVKDLEYIQETKSKNIWKYRFWKWTSDCGRSIWRWAALAMGLAAFFGAVYANYEVWPFVPDWFGLHDLLIKINPEIEFNEAMQVNIFTPYYFSTVTFTTLGFGDVTPLNLAGQIWLCLEVIVGYFMLGGLITLFATKMVRQSG
nr:potassium channel family protein [Desulfovibrio sp. JC010]